VNTAEACTEDVFAVTVTLPVAVAGIVAGALNAPADVVLNEKVVDPMIRVPVVEALKPLPVTVMEDPAGPVAGLKEICPEAACAAPGWTTVKARARPRPAATAVRYVFMDLNTAIGPRNRHGSQVRCRSGGAGRHMHDRKGHVLKLIRT
jgi:hypothetical protein